MSNLVLRVKSQAQTYIINNLNSNSTVDELYSSISHSANVCKGNISLLLGFPPKPMPSCNTATLLHDMGIKSGETLILEVKENNGNAQGKESPNNTAKMKRFVVPANNSCLFTSIHLLMNDGQLDLSSANMLRELVAAIVCSDPATYNDALLGKTNQDYCTWILDSNSWGGAIEISILSANFKVEIAVVDTQTVRIDRFGEDKGYSNRIFLIYDGIHYDPLITENKTIFPCSDEAIFSEALTLASEAHDKKQFTDVYGFTLRCLICQKALRGQNEAQDHAKSSGHINFSEYS